MTKIGFNVLAWTASISKDLYPTVQRLKDIGYDGVEIFYGNDDVEEYQRFGEFCDSIGMEITCVLGLGPDQNLIDPSADVREAGVNRIKWAIDRARDMNSTLICGPFHSAFATFYNKPPDAEEYARSAAGLKLAGDYAAEHNVLLTPEAINRFECYLCNTMEQLSSLVEAVNHPNVKAHYDTHHANIEEKSIPDALRRVAPVLGHVHISENDRGTPGEGHIPFGETFETLSEIGYSGWLTIEAFTRNDPGFANSINVWREYSAPWDVAEKGFELIQSNIEKYNL
ncbi:sugar phosphate isomerase/epimerase family protein [Membranihabitans marinus]|uniref:sugar phosphate isomerase/epimerase family protein n=1 Tax=Membranihabitans marinus TaxID=1227546 RepID=UPI001F389F69|nr:sugar phosphate isomerase/epimerase family protein [Membranihabitans marinus]